MRRVVVIDLGTSRFGQRESIHADALLLKAQLDSLSLAGTFGEIQADIVSSTDEIYALSPAPDLVVFVSISMLEVAKALKKMRPDLRIILLTGGDVKKSNEVEIYVKTGRMEFWETILTD